MSDKPGEKLPERALRFSPSRAPFVLEGFPFFEQEGLYRRLPLNTDSPLFPQVERLCWDSAGGKVRFHAVLKKLSLFARLEYVHSDDHATALIGSGFDCYADDGSGLRFYGPGRFDRSKNEYETVFFDFAEPRELELEVNFPAFNRVHSLLLSFDPDAVVSSPRPHTYKKRIVIYGSSITQGGCASRPGMTYPSLLSRRLDAEVLNLGFNGCGTAREEEAAEIAKIENVGLFVIDADVNCPSAEWVREHFPRFIAILRARRPETPILLLTASPKTHDLYPDRLRARMEKKQAQRELAESLRAAGDGNIHYLDYEDILGESWQDETVDGCHPTDLGFVNIANGLQPVIERLIL